MTKILLLLLLGVSCFTSLFAQHTFSICAVDGSTGEVGSAGASCIHNSFIISDVHPGVGVIHTQANYISANQQYAGSLMDAGIPPYAIIDSMILNDALNNPSSRQYGVVDLVGGGRSSGYTGVNCLDYKNNIEGGYYSIQGNILLGSEVLDSIQSKFLHTQGTLACRLMAALQGANMVGADSRCLDSSTSSLSAFIKVAKPTDTIGNLYLDIVIPSVPSGVEPIDTLQKRFDEWGGCAKGVGVAEVVKQAPTIYPNPAKGLIHFQLPDNANRIEIFDALGRIKDHFEMTGRFTIYNSEKLNPGIYFCRIYYANGKTGDGKFAVK